MFVKQKIFQHWICVKSDIIDYCVLIFSMSLIKILDVVLNDIDETNETTNGERCNVAHSTVPKVYGKSTNKRTFDDMENDKYFKVLTD